MTSLSSIPLNERPKDISQDGQQLCDALHKNLQDIWKRTSQGLEPFYSFKIHAVISDADKKIQEEFVYNLWPVRLRYHNMPSCRN